MLQLKSIHRSILNILKYEKKDVPLLSFVKEFSSFGYKEAISCIFPVVIFSTLAITKFVTVPYFFRYDFLFIVFFITQYLMYRYRLETIEEVKVICLFHLLGICMEVYKVSHNSWAYPDFGYTKIYGVPLYSGFMYASVASYVCQAWRHFELHFIAWPSVKKCFFVTILIYGNFYSNIYFQDIRLIIFPVLFYIFRNTIVKFNTNGRIREMHMVVSFGLIAFFVWIAENIATFLGAWKYPHQHAGWQIVHFNIITSWFLLVVVSVVIVSIIRIFEGDESIEHRSSQDKVLSPAV